MLIDLLLKLLLVGDTVMSNMSAAATVLNEDEKHVWIADFLMCVHSETYSDLFGGCFDYISPVPSSQLV